MSHIVTEEIRTVEEFEKLKKFAATFNHEPCGRYPIIFVRADLQDKSIPVGYVEVISTPIMLTAWVPGCPKECVEAIKKLKAWQEIQHGECLAVVSEGSPLYPLMERLGFTDTGLKLYRSA